MQIYVGQPHFRIIRSNLPSALAPAAHYFEGFLHADKWSEGVALVFDDVPFHARDGFAETEDFLPRMFVVAENENGS